MKTMEVLDKLEASINDILNKNAMLHAEIDRLKQSNEGLTALERENDALKKELELEKNNVFHPMLIA